MRTRKPYYISVRFFSDYNKEYVYKCTLRGLQEDDFVIVPTPKGNTVVQVIEVKIPTPSFQCKEVIKKVDLS